MTSLWCQPRIRALAKLQTQNWKRKKVTTAQNWKRKNFFVVWLSVELIKEKKFSEKTLLLIRIQQKSLFTKFFSLIISTESQTTKKILRSQFCISNFLFLQLIMVHSNLCSIKKVDYGKVSKIHPKFTYFEGLRS